MELLMYNNLKVNLFIVLRQSFLEVSSNSANGQSDKNTLLFQQGMRVCLIYFSENRFFLAFPAISRETQL
jgi:hypothetical protein